MSQGIREVMRNGTETSMRSARGLRSRGTGRMTYFQVVDLVRHLQKQHRRLREAYRAREAEPRASRQEERTDLLFGYLANREQTVDDLLERLSGGERDGILETWIQNADFSEYDRKVDEMIEDLPRDPQQARSEIAVLDRKLVDLYERLETQVTAPSVRRFLGDLRQRIAERAREHSEFLQQVDDL